MARLLWGVFEWIVAFIETDNWSWDRGRTLSAGLQTQFNGESCHWSCVWSQSSREACSPVVYERCLLERVDRPRESQRWIVRGTRFGPWVKSRQSHESRGKILVYVYNCLSFTPRILLEHPKVDLRRRVFGLIK